MGKAQEEGVHAVNGSAIWAMWQTLAPCETAALVDVQVEVSGIDGRVGRDAQNGVWIQDASGYKADPHGLGVAVEGAGLGAVNEGIAVALVVAPAGRRKAVPLPRFIETIIEKRPRRVFRMGRFFSQTIPDRWS